MDPLTLSARNKCVGLAKNSSASGEERHWVSENGAVVRFTRGMGLLFCGEADTSLLDMMGVERPRDSRVTSAFVLLLNFASCTTLTIVTHTATL